MSCTGPGVGCSSGLAIAAVAVATAAPVATAAATFFSVSATLGPRFTGVGVLLPTVFLGLVVLVAAVLVVLGASLEGVGLVSGLERFGVFASTALGVGFLETVSDLAVDFGVSGLADFVAEVVRLRGDSAGFLAAGVAGLVTSFFTAVVVLEVCDAGALPPEGVDGLEVAGFDEEAEDLGAAGLGAAAELLDGWVEPVAGREAGVPEGVLVVLETGVLGEAVELGLVGLEAAGREAAGFFVAAVLELVFTPLAVAEGVFLAAAVVVAVGVFFSAVLGVLLWVGVVPVGFLDAAVTEVLFLSKVEEVFLGTPLVWGLETPLERRLWVVVDFEPEVVLAGVVPGFVLTLLGVLDLESPEGLLLVFAAGASLGGSTGAALPSDCWTISPSAGLAAWLGSCPGTGAPSFTGLLSNISIGSSAAVATPSGFISPSVVVCRCLLHRVATGQSV